MPNTFTIRKADGTTEPFDPAKLEYSLKRAGAAPLTIKRIVSHIQAEGENGLTTYKIYKHAFALLKKERRGVASRYSLKRAIFDLGPTGFPFEDFMAEIMRAHGFAATTGQVLRGKCGEHELDMIASLGNRRIGAEMKFHNSPGLKSDMKVALYVVARFMDLNHQLDSRSKAFTENWLITNTKFTTEALRYGECAGLTMISWSYPRKGNLQDLIEASGLHPITCLTSLSKTHKQALLTRGHVLCKDAKRQPDILQQLGINDTKFDRVMEEIHDLCTAPAVIE